MSTLLVIQAYGGAKDMVYALWKNYHRAGADAILGVNTVDKPFLWPDGNESVRIAVDGYMTDKYQLPVRLRDTIAECLKRRFDNYFITEHDCVFFKCLPEHPGGLVTFRAGCCPKQWRVKAKCFYHPPWWMDRPMALMLHDCMSRLIKNGEVENGGPDLFIGLAIDRLGIKPTQLKTWSCNSRDIYRKMLDAKNAVQKGIFYMHGCRDKAAFHMLMGAAKP